MSAAIALAFGAGLVATVNPCGFAMLPSFLAFFLGADEEGIERESLVARASRGLLVGAVLSAAFGGVFVFAGLIVSAGLRSFVHVVPWLAVAIGAGLVVVGLAMLAGRHVGLTSASRVRVGGGQARGYPRVALFGATYALASLSCTLGIFLVVVGQALAATNVARMFAVFGAYAAGAASVLLALSLSAALAKGALARGIRRLLPIVNRVSGALLLVSGVYLLLYWVPALGSGRAASNSWAARATEGVSTTLASFFAAHTDLFAIALALLSALGAGLVVVNARARRRDPEPADAGAGDDCCVAPVIDGDPRALAVAGNGHFDHAGARDILEVTR